MLSKPPPPAGPRPMPRSLPHFLVGQRAPKVAWDYVLKDRGCCLTKGRGYIGIPLVPRGQQVVYLGTVFSRYDKQRKYKTDLLWQSENQCNTKKTVQYECFWEGANTSISQELRVFDSITNSKLMYDLETIQLTPAEQNEFKCFPNEVHTQDS